MNENKPKSKWSSEEYRAKQYAYYSALIKCDICNCEYSRSHKARHLKSRKHLNIVEMKQKILTDLKEQVKLKIDQKIQLLESIKTNLEKN